MQDIAASRIAALAAHNTLPEVLAARVAQTPEAEAFRQFDQGANAWESVNFRELQTRVNRWRRAIASVGLSRGARLAMLLPNGLDAVCFDLATLSDAHVPVPLHAIDTAGSVAYILNDCQAEVLVTARVSQWEAIRNAGADLPYLKLVVLTDEMPTQAEENGIAVRALDAWLAAAHDVALLAEDFRIVRPTVLLSVPRIYERIYGKIQDKLARGGSFKRYLFDWAVEVGWRNFCRRNNLPLEQTGRAWADPLVWPLLERLVAKPLRAQFGGQLRVAISGGAALGSTVARCFIGLGLPLVQGYGMTETSPVISVNAVDDNHPQTVGRPFGNVEVRLGANDELQIRGPMVMQGYWNRPEDTAAVLSADGWLSTGDQADLSDGGRIRIKGRIKEIIVTSTGEKIPPGDLELAITADPLFEQAYVVGENRPYIAAILVLNPEEWGRFAASLDRDPNDPASLAASDVRQAVVKRVRAATRDFPHYGVPRSVALTLEPWTIDNDLMTPTLKLKRAKLRERFQSTINELYAGHRRP